MASNVFMGSHKCTFGLIVLGWEFKKNKVRMSYVDYP